MLQQLLLLPVPLLPPQLLIVMATSRQSHTEV
jgi:hypothetical protein